LIPVVGDDPNFLGDNSVVDAMGVGWGGFASEAGVTAAAAGVKECIQKNRSLSWVDVNASTPRIDDAVRLSL
jgi:hypothetical protein